MSDESNEFEGFRVVDSGEPVDDGVDEFAAPGRWSSATTTSPLRRTTTPSRTGASRRPGRCRRSVVMRR